MTHPREKEPEMVEAAQIARLAEGLTVSDWYGLECEGEIWGMPLSANRMRPLVRKGLFERIVRKGFQTRWAITPLGTALLAHLTTAAQEKKDD